MAAPRPDDPPEEVSRLIEAATAGDAQAAAELLPVLYTELRALAAARIARLAPGQSLDATELVHEAYMRLVGSTDPGWDGRAHFFGAAARAMRDVVADHLRREASLKRGGHLRRVGEATAAELTCDGPHPDALALAEALEELEREYPRKAQVVTLGVFGGLTVEEIAALLELSTRTVERDQRFARSWLNGRLAGPAEPQ